MTPQEIAAMASQNYNGTPAPQAPQAAPAMPQAAAPQAPQAAPAMPQAAAPQAPQAAPAMPQAAAPQEPVAPAYQHPAAPQAAPAMPQAAAPQEPVAPDYRHPADLQAAPVMPAPAVQEAPAPMPVPAAQGTAVVGFESFADSLLADAGLGTEEADHSSVSIPYIYLVQLLSPVRSETVKEGMFFNNISSEAYTEFTFLPVHFQRRFTRFDPKTNKLLASYKASEIEGGHIRGVYHDGHYDFAIRDQLGDHPLVDTRVHYVLYLNPNTNGWETAVFNLTRTQIKASKRLISMIQLSELHVKGRNISNPPAWCYAYKATAALERNEKGHWFTWNFTRVGPNYPELYERAKAFHNSLKNMELESISPNIEDTLTIQAQQQHQQPQAPYSAPQAQGYYQGGPNQYGAPQAPYSAPQSQSYYQGGPNQYAPYSSYGAGAGAGSAPAPAASYNGGIVDGSLGDDGDDVPF